VLVVKRGPNVGTRYTLEQAVTRAGRHPESDIFLDDITVSRRHAELERQSNGSIVIRDDGSLNGTYVNRERIEEQALSGGDEVQIGKFKLVYLVAGDE
jgi:pSer/pThr/pTyr-binding forkhead associated (FHA) protein